MRNASYRYGNTAPNMSGIGGCFQNCRMHTYFEYDFYLSHIYQFIPTLTKEELVAYVVDMVNDFIVELDLAVDFKHSVKGETHTFSFAEKTKDRYDMYAAMIMSRYFVSDYTEYEGLIRVMAVLRKEGYSPMESYIIASVFYGAGEYSFYNRAFVDIEKYREMKNPKELLLNRAKGALNIAFGSALDATDLSGMNQNRGTQLRTAKSIVKIYDSLRETVHQLKSTFFRIDYDVLRTAIGDKESAINSLETWKNAYFTLEEIHNKVVFSGKDALISGNGDKMQYIYWAPLCKGAFVKISEKEYLEHYAEATKEAVAKNTFNGLNSKVNRMLSLFTPEQVLTKMKSYNLI